MRNRQTEWFRFVQSFPISKNVVYTLYSRRLSALMIFAGGDLHTYELLTDRSIHELTVIIHDSRAILICQTTVRTTVPPQHITKQARKKARSNHFLRMRDTLLSRGISSSSFE